MPSTRRCLCTQVPSLDLGGKCVAGSTILVKPALDTKGNLVGPDAVNPKYGTPKCEFHCQLAKLPGGGWVGAHPSLGERAAVALLQRSPVLGDVWTGDRAKAEIRREASFEVLSGPLNVRLTELRGVLDAGMYP